MGRMGSPEACGCGCDGGCGDATTKAASLHVPIILDALSQYPRFYDDVVKIAGFDSGQFNTKLAADLQPYGDARITSGDYLSRRFTPDMYTSNEPARTDMFSYTDPVTGHSYQTNRGAIDQTHDALSDQAYKRKAMTAAPLLGASAVMGTAAMSGRLSGAKKLLAGGGAALTGLAGVNQITKPTQLAGPVVNTDQGKPISGYTEMMRTAAEDVPELNYMLRRAVDGPRQIMPPKYAEALSKAIKTAEVHDELSPVLGPTLDLDQVAKTIGDSIVSWTF